MNPICITKKDDNLVCFLVSILFLLLAIVVCHAHAVWTLNHSHMLLHIRSKFQI